MLVQLKHMHSDEVLVVDTEFDGDKLLQVAALFLRREKGDLYRLCNSFNQYILRNKIGFFARRETGLTPETLQTKGGVEFDAFAAEFNGFLADLSLDKAVFVSHGTKNDRGVLRNSGFKLPEHSYCTYRNAERILQRNSNLRLQDVAAESGFKGGEFHDAFVDAWATLSSLSYLLDKQER